MSRSICPHGHEWESAGPEPCPVCGASATSLTDAPTLPPADTSGDTLGLPSGVTPRVITFPLVPGYEILGELGRGGMGVVYKAQHEKLQRIVALKMILAGVHAGEGDLARFRTEAEAVARLGHPNIVQIYEVDEHDGLPYFSLEFIDGGSLESRLRGAQLSWADVAKLILALARAMHSAHERGIVHRDLKPANVLLMRDGTPKITDFGLARKLDEQGQTRTGSVMGTPSYMAPEQAAGSKQTGPPADIYALGAILYECITGRPPFRAPTAMDTVLQVLYDDPLPPRQIHADVPRDLEAVCLKCLDKSPGRRYASAAELADDLGRYLEGEPVLALQSGLFDRLAGALDRVQLQASFAAYGSLLLWLAPVMFLPEVWVTLVVLNEWPGTLLPIAQFGRVFAFLGVVGYHRGWQFLPRGAGERQLWGVWLGYLLACFAMGLSSRLGARDLEGAAIEPTFYPALAALTGLAFITLAGNFWGYCAVIGAGFLALAFVMALDLRWAMLEFGTTWAVVLVLLGVRLRRLGRTG